MLLRQNPDQVVDVADWAPEEAVYPEGSRTKSTFISPPVPEFAGLKPDHRYLFKLSADRYPTQFWAEIIAYRIGAFIGIPVPPAFVALNSREQVFGALIEWFYSDQAAGDGFNRYVSGGQYMRRMINGYDIVKGTQHNFQSVWDLCRAFHIGTHLIEPPLRHWSGVMLFDALIGNQDRHQDNWGFVWQFNRAVGKKMLARFAPAFDNGTSLGHEILEERLGVAMQPDRLDRYVLRGRHHMRWALADQVQAGHFEMITKLTEKWPKTKQHMASLLAYDPAKLEAELGDLVAFPVPAPYALSADRLRWVCALLRARRDHLLAVLS